MRVIALVQLIRADVWKEGAGDLVRTAKSFARSYEALVPIFTAEESKSMVGAGTIRDTAHNIYIPCADIAELGPCRLIGRFDQNVDLEFVLRPCPCGRAALVT